MKRELRERKDELASNTKELKRTQDRLAEKSRQMTVVEREAQAFKDKAESKDATVLRQSKQLAELVESRQEDSRKLQMAESKAKEAEEKRRREEELRRQLEAVRDELTDGLESCHESIKEYQAEVAELSANCGSAERRNAAMAEDLRVAKGWSALYEIEMRKLEEELEVEVKVSVGCDPDERIDDDVEPCEVDPEELRHYLALKRQYHYLGFDDLCKIPGFSGVLRRTRLRSPRGLAESSEKKEGAAGY